MPRFAQIVAILVALLAVWQPSSAFAQRAPRAELRMAAGPHYAEVPIALQIRIEGLDEKPEPSVQAVDAGKNVTLRKGSVDPQVSSFLRIINGRRTETKTVVWSANFEILVASPGPFEVPAFEVKQGGTTLETRPRTLVAGEVPISDRIEIALTLPNRPIYPGQRVPVTLRMTFDAPLQERYGGHRIRCSLFELDRDFDFVGIEPRRGEPSLVVSAGGETRQLRARATRRDAADGAVVDVVATPTLVPLRPGKYSIDPSILIFEEVTRWRRGVFPSDRRPAEKRLLLARDLSRTLEVRELPATGRPASFAGAVGRGFSIALEADRTVLQVGDPITFTITLRGDGNLENAGLPSLDAAGLAAGSFQVPGGEAPGMYEDDVKTFRVTVRVKDDSVDEVPPLEYAWFDPDAESYRTTTTEPIALSVRRGETVGADALVGAPDGGSRNDPDAALVRGPTAGRPRFTLVGADLSLETRAEVLSISERSRFGGTPMQSIIYTLSFLLVIGAVGLRVRDRVPSEVRGRRGRLLASRREVDAASRVVGADSLRTIAGMLRTMNREVKQSGGRSTDGLETFLSECEARIYDPQGGTTAPEELGARARELARALEQAGR